MKRLGEKGQSTIEFALTMLLFLGFVFFYFQLSMVFAFGNFVHYATFMGARAYLSSGPTRGDQVSRAKSVVTRMLKRSENQPGLDKFPSIAKGIGGGDPPGFTAEPPNNYNAGSQDLSWQQGVRYKFRSKLFILAFGGSDKGAPSKDGGPPGSITLTSESWLGREPAVDECEDYFGKQGWFFDNGC